MLNISTKFHGAREINEDKILTFQNGLPGFEDETQFVLLELEDTTFCVLQSVKTTEVAFIIMNPFEVFPFYEIDLSQDVLDELQLETEQDVALFVILTIHEPFEASTANLQAPIVLNTTKKTGKQYIMKTNKFTTSHAFVETLVLETQEAK